MADLVENGLALPGAAEVLERYERAVPCLVAWGSVLAALRPGARTSNSTAWS